MILSLAQLPAPESAQAIGWLALAGFAIAGGVNQVLKFFDRFKETPPSHQTYATKSEHGELANRVDRVDEKIDANYKALDQKRSISVANLHDALKEQTDALNKRIDAVPQNVITLLKDVKALQKE